MKKLDSKKIDKDFAKVCKKHKLQKVAIAIEVPAGKGKYTAMSSCHIKGKTGTGQEMKFALSVAHLFQSISFQDKNIDIATSIIKSRLKTEQPSKEELALSETDRFWLEAIRRKKFDLIKRKRYEEASKLRDEERKLLGIREEPEKNHAAGRAFDMDSIVGNAADIKKMGEIVFDAIKKDMKNWKTKQ